MAELKSALLFCVTIHFKIKIGAHSRGFVSFGLVWFASLFIKRRDFF